MPQREPVTSEGPTPFLLAILVCDTIIHDALRGKATLVGIFDTVTVRKFPAEQQLSLYVRLTDAQGKYRVKVEFVRIETDQVLTEGSGNIQEDDRLGIVEMALELMVPLPAAGKYEFRVWANDRYVGRAFFNVAQSLQGDGG